MLLPVQLALFMPGSSALCPSHASSRCHPHGLGVQQLVHCVALAGLQPRLRRHRPLTRAGEQLLFDLAGLLSGLRSLIMLDTAPGATPAMLQQVLQPVAALLPGFSGDASVNSSGQGQPELPSVGCLFGICHSGV